LLDSACSGNVKITSIISEGTDSPDSKNGERRKADRADGPLCKGNTRGKLAQSADHHHTLPSARLACYCTQTAEAPFWHAAAFPVDVRFWARPNRSTSPTRTSHRLFLLHAKRSCRLEILFKLMRIIYSANTLCRQSQKSLCPQKACICDAPPSRSPVEGLGECGLTYRHITTSEHRTAAQTAAVQHSVR
jgi:hypothetical protein